jgi:hypothetical protein
LSLLEEDLVDLDLEVAVVLAASLKFQRQGQYPMEQSGQLL